ncbi:MAG TPA: ribonuclease P protein component [Dehalococcoidia bacterium]|nr:ribonuclease P protein component [Dehalococcoidia bacterium]
MGLPKQIRLRHRKDFDAVFRSGRTWSNDLLVLRTLPNEADHNRYGFVTSKRLGGAVVRNRVRRRLREAVRALDTRPGFDCVISAKTKAAEADFSRLRQATASLLERAGVLASNDEAPA